MWHWLIMAMTAFGPFHITGIWRVTVPITVLRVRNQTMHTAPNCLDIAVPARGELDAALDEAVDFLKPAAVSEQVGISVTRLAPGRYEARLDSSVPPGVTLERWGV